jgi:hypothetical protein
MTKLSHREGGGIWEKKTLTAEKTKDQANTAIDIIPTCDNGQDQ